MQVQKYNKSLTWEAWFLHSRNWIPFDSLARKLRLDDLIAAGLSDANLPSLQVPRELYTTNKKTVIVKQSFKMELYTTETQLLTAPRTKISIPNQRTFDNNQ